MTAVLALDSIFDTGQRRNLTVPPGCTIADMVAAAFPGLTGALRATIRATIGDQAIEEQLWHRVRPKPGTLVILKPIPQGDILRNVLTIAVTVGAIALGQFYAPVLAGSLLGLPGAATGTLAGALQFGITGSVLLAGTLLLNALVPLKGPTQDRTKYTVQGLRNQATPDGQVPLVLGNMRSAPPYAALPYTEAVGDDQYVTAAFCFGYGPLQIENMRIGETPIEKFKDIQVETRQGLGTDTPLTLYPQQVIEQALNIELSQFYGAESRFTAADATEASIDVSFPGGLVGYKKNGSKASLTVTIQIAYRLVGDTDFTSQPDLTFTSNKQTPILRTYRFVFPTRGRYEFKLTRVTEDWDDEDQSGNSTQKTGRSFWAALRSIRPEYIINFDKPLALAAIRIRATKQLQGTLDQFNADVSCICPDWDAASGTWITRATQNPASLFRYVLTGPAIRYPLDGSEIDTALADWHAFCASKGLAYNRIHDYEASVFDVLTDIAAAGRATPQDRGTAWGVVIDQALDTITGHISPRNSWGFQGQRPYAVFPDAFRVTFLDETNEFAQAERIVPFPGFSGDPVTFESIELNGVTNPDLVWKETRRRQYELLYRPDTYTVNQDFEALQVSRGDRVQLSHDVLDRATIAARVRTVLGNRVVLDDAVTMVAGQSYACRFRKADGTSLLRTVQTEVGKSASLVLTGTGDLPEAGDLAMFGLASSETLACTVKSIEAMSDFTARLTLVDHAPQIESMTDAEVPPAWSGRAGEVVTAWTEAPVAPVITSITSGIAAAGAATSDVPYPVVVGLQPGPSNSVPIASYDVQHRPVGSSTWVTSSAPAGAGAVLLPGHAKGDNIELQARAVSVNGTPGDWTAIVDHTVGASDPPAPSTPASLSVAAGDTAGTVTLTMVSGPSANNAAVEVLRALGATATLGDADAIATINAGPNVSLTYADTGLASGSYRYWIVALDDNDPPIPSAATGPADITLT